MWDMNYPQIMSPVPFASESGGHVPLLLWERRPWHYPPSCWTSTAIAPLHEKFSLLCALMLVVLFLWVPRACFRIFHSSLYRVGCRGGAKGRTSDWRSRGHRSTPARALMKPETSIKTSDRAFAVAAATTWNCQNSDHTSPQFTRLLKTHLFTLGWSRTVPQVPLTHYLLIIMAPLYKSTIDWLIDWWCNNLGQTVHTPLCLCRQAV